MTITLFFTPPDGAIFCCGDQVILLKLSFSVRRGGFFGFVLLLDSLRMEKGRKSHAEEKLFKIRSVMQGHL